MFTAVGTLNFITYIYNDIQKLHIKYSRWGVDEMQAFRITEPEQIT